MKYVSLALALILALLAVPPPADAQTRTRPGAQKARKDVPSFALEARRKAKSKDELNEQTIIANIENQKMIIELEDPSSPDYSDMVIALADFYWDLSEVYFRKAHTDELEQKIFDAEERKDQTALAKWKGQQDQLEGMRAQYQQQTVDTYRDVLRRFPNAAKVDEIRYFLAYNLQSMGRAEEAIEAYQDLLRRHPDSTYVPDALVNMGEYYFENNDYGSALKLYEAVEQYPEAPVLGYAVYKQGWSHYNLGAYDLALSKLLRVIKMTQEQDAAGVKGALDLMSEAQNDLVYPYSKIGKVGQAIAFFKKYAPERYLELASRLAALYTEQTEYANSIKLLRDLIKEARRPQPDGRDRKHMVLRFQRQIVENTYPQVDKEATVAEVRELIRLFEEMKPEAPEAFIRKEEKAIDTMVLEIATAFHNEYKSTKAQATLEYTQALYDEYLRLFRGNPNAYDISYNNALLMLMTGKYREAAAEFEKVIGMQPQGKYADDSAERAVVAYLKTIQVENRALKNEAESDLNKRELSPDEQQFVQAVDRWMKIVDTQGPREETAENIPPARFAAAKILYNANHFEDAATRFATFVDKHPDHPFREDAARHVLSSYNLAHDVDNLRKYANLYEKDKALMSTPLAADVARIRNEFNFQECFKFEKREEFLGAAKCFIDYSGEFATSERAPAAVYNAGLNYFRAKRVEKALETQKRLFEQFGNHELAPKALYSIGEIFRETTVYDQAADVYEFFVQSYPDHPLAEQALRYSSIFRKTLGQYDKAVSDLDLYLKRYPKENAPRVHLDIIIIREKQERASVVLKLVTEHLRRFRDEPAPLRMQALAARGRAYEMKGDDRNAQKAFQETVDAFAALDEETKKAFDLEAISAVAESHFNLGEVKLREAQRQKLTGSEKAMQAAIQKKLELMNEAKTIYEQVIGYGHPGWTIAAYAQLGLAYRDLADAVENSPVPKRIAFRPEAVDEYRQIMTEKAAPIRQKALESYRTATRIARDAHWFNEYSEKAEQAIAQLDLTDVSIKEARLRPDRTGPNAGLPEFKREVR